MPDLRKHLRSAEDNEDAGKYLISENRFMEWAVTIFFYAAVHHVEAYLYHVHGTHNRDHKTRDNYFQRDRNLKRISDEYWDLKNDSEAARYDCNSFSRIDVVTHIQPNFERVKKHISNLLP